MIRGLTCSVLLSALTASLFSSVHGDDKVGYGDQAELVDNVDTASGRGILSNDPNLRLDCCGTIKAWRVSPTGSASLNMQIWRPVGDSKYQLVDQNILKVYQTDSPLTFSIPKHLRIPVEDGDRIGWSTAGPAVVPYKKAGSRPLSFVMEGILDVVTLPVDWSTAERENGRQYAVEAILETNSAPVFGIFPSTIVISNETAVGSVAFKVIVTDDDPQDVKELSISLEKQSKYFEINHTSKEVFIKQMPVLGNYSLSLSVSDRCQSSSTKDIAIVIIQPVQVFFTGAQDGNSYEWVIGVSVAFALLLVVAVVLATLCHLGYLNLPR